MSQARQAIVYDCFGRRVAEMAGGLSSRWQRVNCLQMPRWGQVEAPPVRLFPCFANSPGSSRRDTRQATDNYRGMQISSNFPALSQRVLLNSQYLGRVN